MSASTITFVLRPPSAPAHAHTNACPGVEDGRPPRLQEGRPQESPRSSHRPGEMLAKALYPNNGLDAAFLMIHALFWDSVPDLLTGSWSLGIRV